MTGSGTVYVALLRGINVGGKRKVPMARLREVAEDLGLTDVSTYINSGNLIFSSAKRASALTAALRTAIADAVGFAVDLLVVDPAALRRVIDGDPFRDGNPRQVNVTFLSAPLPASVRDALRELAAEGERLDFGDRGATWVYADHAGGMAGSKLAAKLHSTIPDITATTRNIATVRKLLDLATAIG